MDKNLAAKLLTQDEFVEFLIKEVDFDGVYEKWLQRKCSVKLKIYTEDEFSATMKVHAEGYNYANYQKRIKEISVKDEVESKIWPLIIYNKIVYAAFGKGGMNIICETLPYDDTNALFDKVTFRSLDDLKFRLIFERGKQLCYCNFQFAIENSEICISTSSYFEGDKDYIIDMVPFAFDTGTLSISQKFIDIIFTPFEGDGRSKKGLCGIDGEPKGRVNFTIKRFGKTKLMTMVRNPK